jgi:hypothetical protein
MKMELKNKKLNKKNSIPKNTNSVLTYKKARKPVNAM